MTAWISLLPLVSAAPGLYHIRAPGDSAALGSIIF